MTPDVTLENSVDPVPVVEQPSTVGMTTKVVKGSIWTLGGSVLPLAVSFVSTPFVIRFLGSEAYGVLLLVGLIPTYFSFADFGMSVASTKYASEAHGEGDDEKENQFVWTAAAVAAVTAGAIGVPLILFSYPIVSAMNVPEQLLSQASIALKITSAAFVLTILCQVFNSPMLARIRMDLNTITQTVPKILLSAVTPVILYFGGGIVAAVTWAFLIGLLMLGTELWFSGKLLPALWKPKVNPALLRPLLKVGGGWFIAIIAGVLIGQLERLILARQVSSRALAYYGVAFTFANTATLFSQALLQSLLPAFSQMLTPEKREQLSQLFARGVRLLTISLLPLCTFLIVIGRPFLTLWAGEEFGINSTPAFYILVGGFSLSMFSVLPYSILLAAGRTDYFAKMYWIELPLYAGLSWVLVERYGVAGAALAYACRNVFDALWANYFGRRLFRLRYGLRSYLGPLTVGICLLTVPVAIVGSVGGTLLPISTAFLAVLVYLCICWKFLLRDDERGLIQRRLQLVLRPLRT